MQKSGYNLNGTERSNEKLSVKFLVYNIRFGETIKMQENMSKEMLMRASINAEGFTILPHIFVFE